MIEEAVLAWSCWLKMEKSSAPTATWWRMRMILEISVLASVTVAALVAMVPQGLVLLTSIAFAVSAVKLARRKVLTRELPAVEGLARVGVVLSGGNVDFEDLARY